MFAVTVAIWEFRLVANLGVIVDTVLAVIAEEFADSLVNFLLRDWRFFFVSSSQEIILHELIIQEAMERLMMEDNEVDRAVKKVEISTQTDSNLDSKYPPQGSRAQALWRTVYNRIKPSHQTVDPPVLSESRTKTDSIL